MLDKIEVRLKELADVEKQLTDQYLVTIGRAELINRELGRVQGTIKELSDMLPEKESE